MMYSGYISLERNYDVISIETKHTDIDSAVLEYEIRQLYFFISDY